MRTKRILSIGAGLCVLLLAACGSGEPKTYEDCLLKALEGGGKSDAAVGLIVMACREKFPEEAESKASETVTEEIDLNAEQLLEVSFGGSLEGSSHFSGGISNRTAAITLTEVKVSVMTNVGSGGIKKYDYRLDVNIPPGSFEQVNFKLRRTASTPYYSAKMESAKGTRERRL